MNNPKGQALLESLLAIPFLMGLVSLIIVGLYNFGSHYLVDHWVYQASLCVAKSEDPAACKKVLRQNLSSLPFSVYKITNFAFDHKIIQVEVLQKRLSQSDSIFTNQIILPLTVQDFSEAL